jgi:hypothetical protein
MREGGREGGSEGRRTSKEEEEGKKRRKEEKKKRTDTYTWKKRGADLDLIRRQTKQSVS